MSWAFYDKNGNLKQAAASAINPAVELNTTTTGVPNTGVPTPLSSWSLETYKTVGSMHSGFDGKLFASRTGRYLVSAELEWGAPPTVSQIYFRKNGLTTVTTGAPVSASVNGGTVTKVILLNAGDYLEFLAMQSSATNPLFPLASTTFSMEYLDGAIQVPVAYPASLVGQTLSYVEFNTNVACPSATLTTIVTASAITADGVSSYMVEFYCAQFSSGVGSRSSFFLYDGASNLGEIGTEFDSATEQSPQHLVRYVTSPSVGSHTYSIACNPTGASTARGLTNDAGASIVPGFIRVTKVS